MAPRSGPPRPGTTRAGHDGVAYVRMSDPAPSVPQRVVVKFRDEVTVPGSYAVASAAGDAPDWTSIQEACPGIRIALLFGEHERDALARIDATRLLSYVALELPAGASPDEVMRIARQLGGVEDVYLEDGPSEPPWTPSGTNPRLVNERHHDPAPVGVDVRAAWAEPGGTGRNTNIIDVEQGWTLDHEDLTGANVTLPSGRNQTFFYHGTRMLGIMVGQDNDLGVVGIVPHAPTRVVSEWRPDGSFNRASAIIAATLLMRRGDVMLLEMQSPPTGPGPVEHERAVFDAILAATTAGIHVIEPAGNMMVDLDTWNDAAGRTILNRNSRQYQGDSGAIMVGCCTSAVPHRRLTTEPGRNSSFGSRVDCFAWGHNITTTDSDTTHATTMYTANSGGTSGASAIIASVVASLTSMVYERALLRMSPRDVRDALTSARNTTASGAPATDRIGVMPDLRKLIANVVQSYIVDTGPMPSYAGRALAFLDPGHGGAVADGHSSPFGGRGPGGTFEKDVNLNVARQVRRHLGGAAALSRDDDRNLSLRARTDAARRSGAPVFVSLHANQGRPGGRGGEIWVYGDAQHPPDRRSVALAQAIGAQLGGAQQVAVPVLIGKLATLDPANHAPGCAACLVEVDDLSSRDGEARLTDPHGVGALGGAIARGVREYLGC